MTASSSSTGISTFRRLPARPARGRVRQHLPCVHRRRPLQRICRLGRGRGRDPQHRRRRDRRDRRFPPSLFLRETPLTKPDDAIAGFAAAARKAAGDDNLKLLHTVLAQLHRRHNLRSRSDPCRHHGRRGLRPQARRVPGPHAHLHCRGAQCRHSGALYQRPFHRDDGVVDQDAGHAWAEAFVPTSAGSHSTPRMGSAPPTHISGLRPGSTIWGRHRSGASATGVPARRCQSMSRSNRRRGSHKADRVSRIPKFARFGGTFIANFGFKGTLRGVLIRVPECLLAGVKQTSKIKDVTSGFDPTAT